MSAALRTAARGWLGDEDKATLVPPSATLDENPVAAGLEASGLQKTHEPGWSGEWYGIVPDRGRYASFPNPVSRGSCWLFSVRTIPKTVHPLHQSDNRDRRHPAIGYVIAMGLVEINEVRNGQGKTTGRGRL